MNNQLKVMGERVTGFGRQMYLAGLGATVGAGDKAVSVFDELVDKGRDRQSGDPGPLTKLSRKAQGTYASVSEQVEKRLQNRVIAVLHAFNVPARDDVQSLRASVDRLNKKVQALQK